MAVTKRLRYEVLNRDGHRCRYCGITAAETKLVVDAVIPAALGGSHKDPANLVTACEPCNSGKTSSHPDAPKVADVAEDALRWSQAMTVAAGEMLARASEQVDAHQHFAKAWARYGTGPRRTPLPKDPGWQHTVDCLLAAGLPMGLLEECIEIAMSQRRVAEDNVFRYMCGVAWRKVTELQQRARELASDPPSAEDEGDEDPESTAIENWCRIILKQRDPREVEAATRRCREQAGDECPNGILWFVISEIESERSTLREALTDLMRVLPGEVGTRLIAEHEAWYREHAGADYNPVTALFTASQYAAEYMALARAREEMAFMSRTDRDALVQRARDENADILEHLTEAYLVTEAARMAREARSALVPCGEG